LFWINPESGELLKTVNMTANNNRIKPEMPYYQVDIALKIIKK
jgi:hypothetical protein